MRQGVRSSGPLGPESWHRKVLGLRDGEYRMILRPSHALPACDGRTDRQTDRPPMAKSRSRIAERDRNITVCADVFIPLRYSPGGSTLQYVQMLFGCRTRICLMLLNPPRKGGGLHSGDVLLFVCLSVRSFVRLSLAYEIS